MKKLFSLVLACCTVFIPLVFSNHGSLALHSPARSKAGVEIEHQLNDQDALNLERLSPGWVRFHIKWDLVETAPGRYDWKSPEAQRFRRIVSAARRAGAVPLVTVKLAPAFYRSLPDRCARPDAKDGEAALGRFILALAGRYKGLQVFEIWNEPDTPAGGLHQDFLGCFIEEDGPAAAGQYYGKLVNEVAAVVKARRPELVLAGPGIEGNMEFLNHALAAGGRSLDVISLHHYEAYRSADGPQYNLQNLEGKIQAVDLFQASHGLDLPYLVSEGALRCAVGAAFTGITHTCTAFPDFYRQQADWLRTLNGWAQGNEAVLGFIWYTSQQNGWDDTDLVFPTYERKPVFAEFVDLTSADAAQPKNKSARIER